MGRRFGGSWSLMHGLSGKTCLFLVVVCVHFVSHIYCIAAVLFLCRLKQEKTDRLKKEGLGCLKNENDSLSCLGMHNFELVKLRTFDLTPEMHPNNVRSVEEALQNRHALLSFIFMSAQLCSLRLKILERMGVQQGKHVVHKTSKDQVNVRSGNTSKSTDRTNPKSSRASGPRNVDGTAAQSGHNVASNNSLRGSTVEEILACVGIKVHEGIRQPMHLRSSGFIEAPPGCVLVNPKGVAVDRLVYGTQSQKPCGGERKVVVKLARTEKEIQRFGREVRTLEKLMRYCSVRGGSVPFAKLLGRYTLQFDSCDDTRVSALVVEDCGNWETMSTVDEGLEFARQLIDSVKWLHDAGYVHLDVKPRNVVVSLPFSARSAALSSGESDVENRPPRNKSSSSGSDSDGKKKGMMKVRLVDFDLSERLTGKKKKGFCGTHGHVAPEVAAWESDTQGRRAVSWDPVLADAFGVGHTIEEACEFLRPPLRASLSAGDKQGVAVLESIISGLTRPNPSRRWSLGYAAYELGLWRSFV